MNKQDVARQITANRRDFSAPMGRGIAPANIALVKYWGKRDEELNLPVTSSLSVGLRHLGTTTTLEPVKGPDVIILNGLAVPDDTSFARRLRAYLDLFRPGPDDGYRVVTTNTIPTAAGLASSASGYAALVLALNNLHAWNLQSRELSILARLGSGSASRSLHDGFVEWHAGRAADGMDSYAEPLSSTFPGLLIGLVKISVREKHIGSREAMKRTVDHAPLYRAWPAQVAHDLETIRNAIRARDFEALGRTAENNALAMHATAIASWPPTLFWLPESVKAMQSVWDLREKGVAVYFTMDAGPNLKLLAEEGCREIIQKHFTGIEWVEPFAESQGLQPGK